MQTAKPTLSFKYDSFDIEMSVFAQQKLSISVIDSASNSEYYQKELILQKIGCNTLIKAFQKSKKEIKLEFAPKLISETQLLEIKISIQSPFLKGLQEVVLLKKVRDVSQTETVKKQIDYLSRRIKQLKETSLKSKAITYYGATMEQKFFNGSSYQTLASIKLPKGRYLLTINLLLKTQNQWAYLYINQGTSVMTNSGFYMPASGIFTPYTLRKIYTVTGQAQIVCFTTSAASSYPITVRNVVITAKSLDQ